MHIGVLLPALRFVRRAPALGLFALTIVAGLYGTADPLMNLAPTMVWIVWWVGLSLIVACVGNVWPALDPWRTRWYDLLDWGARGLGASRGLTLGWRYPPALGAWPAVVLLLSLSWFEVAYPQAAVPYRLACVALAWSAVTLLGMVCFGADTCAPQCRRFLRFTSRRSGRFAPLAAGSDARSLTLRAPGRGLIAEPASSIAMVCFVMAMLSTVLFDGLLSGQVWWLTQTRIARAVPFLVDPDGYRMGAAGLVGVWLMFLGAYALTSTITARLVPRYTMWDKLPACSPIRWCRSRGQHTTSRTTAHELPRPGDSNLIALASDPLGLKWNLFGTANFRPDIGLIDARVTWVCRDRGHRRRPRHSPIWLAHRLALREFGTRRRGRPGHRPAHPADGRLYGDQPLRHRRSRWSYSNCAGCGDK